MVPFETLRGTDIFSGLTDGELESVAGLGGREVFKAGAYLFREGEEATKLCIVEQGRVAIQIELGQGRTVIVSTLSAGETVAWSALVPPHELTASARCVTDTRVTAFPAEALRQLCAARPALGLKVLGNIAQIASSRLRDTRLQLVSFIHP